MDDPSFDTCQRFFWRCAATQSAHSLSRELAQPTARIYPMPLGVSPHGQLRERRGAKGARRLPRVRGRVQRGALPGGPPRIPDERLHALGRQLLPMLRACRCEVGKVSKGFFIPG